MMAEEILSSNKTENLQDIISHFLQEVRKILGSKLSKMILYGSYARGDYHENSDVDIMILTHLTAEEIGRVENRIFDVAFDFQMKYLIDISVVVKNEKQFNYCLGALPFYDNVQKEGIVLGG